MDSTIERETGPFPFADWRAMRACYRTSQCVPVPWWRWLLAGRWAALAFALRVRVPDGRGFYGMGVSGASWCWPWQWYERYYVNRRNAWLSGR